MSLVNFTPNTQHAGLTGRQASIPYNRILLSQMPAARQFMADEAIRLEKEKQFEQQQALQRKLQDEQKKQGSMDALIRGGNLMMEVGKLTKDQWMPLLKEGGAGVLQNLIPDLSFNALKELPAMAMSEGAKLLPNAIPVAADAAKNTIAGLAGQTAVDASKDALTGVLADTALQTGAETAAQTGIMNTLGNTIAGLAANVGNYMNPWAAVAHAAGKLGGWGLEAIGNNNDMPQISLLGKTFQDATSGGGVAKPIVEEIFDADSARKINETMDVFNPIGAALFDGKAGQLWDNVTEPFKTEEFWKTGELIGGVWDSIWGASDASNIAFGLLNPVGGILKAVTGGCIIITACTSDNSAEVAIARAYRDKYLSQQQLRGYYMIAEKLVPRMITRPWLTRLIKNALVKPLIAYGHHALVLSMPPPTMTARIVTNLFLGLIACVGRTRKQFTRANGEII